MPGKDKRCGIRMECWCGSDLEWAEGTMELVCERTGKTVLSYTFQLAPSR